MSLLELHRAFLTEAVDRLAADERVAAVTLTGSGGRGEADEWSDLDINVIADDDRSEGVLSCAASAEEHGDLAVWVDCSFNAPPKGAMSFARYLVDDDLVLVDWHVWPLPLARLTARREDAAAFAGHLGLTFPYTSAAAQLDVLDRHLDTLQRVSPRAHGSQHVAGWTRSGRPCEHLDLAQNQAYDVRRGGVVLDRGDRRVVVGPAVGGRPRR